MKSKLTMRYPSAWHKEMWREGAPFGNGLIGGMVYGGVFCGACSYAIFG